MYDEITIKALTIANNLIEKIMISSNSIVVFHYFYDEMASSIPYISGNYSDR